MVRDFEDVIKKPVREPSSVYYTGVDLGTACVVLAVLDEHLRPVAGTDSCVCHDGCLLLNSWELVVCSPHIG